MGRRQRPSGEPLVEWPKPSHNWPSHRDLIERHVARVIVPPQALEVRLNPASACGSYGYRSRQSPALFVGRAGAENWAPFVAAAIMRAIDSRDAIAWCDSGLQAKTAFPLKKRIVCRPKSLPKLWTSCRRPPDSPRVPCEPVEPVSVCNRTGLRPAEREMYEW